MTFDEQQAERAAKGETVFAGTWLPAGEGLYLVSATTIDDLKIRIDELEHKLALREAFIAGLQFNKAKEGE